MTDRKGWYPAIVRDEDTRETWAEQEWSGRGMSRGVRAAAAFVVLAAVLGFLAVALAG